MYPCIRRTALLLIALVIALPAAAGDSVPFRAVFQTAPVPTGSCGPGCVALEIGGDGEASGTYSGTAAGPSGELLLTGRLSSPGANK